MVVFSLIEPNPILRNQVEGNAEGYVHCDDRIGGSQAIANVRMQAVGTGPFHCLDYPARHRREVARNQRFGSDGSAVKPTPISAEELTTSAEELRS